MYIHPNRVKRKTDTTFVKQSAIVSFILVVAMVFVNLGAVAYIMLAKGDEYRQKAASNQLYDVSIEGIRGTIYDSNMTPLATSTTAWILCVNPKAIKNKFEDNSFLNKENRYDIFINDISKRFAKILGMKKSEIKAMLLQSELSYKRIKKEVSPTQKIALDAIINKPYGFPYTYVDNGLFKDKTEERTYDISISSLFTYESDSIREYSQSNFASTVIGVINAENKGETGIERHYNNVLEGTAGRIVTAKDSRGRILESSYETVFDAGEGNGIVLTIDSNIQSYLENALNRAHASIKSDGVYGIVMDVKTGAVLAVSDKPDFDLNNPRELVSKAAKEELKKYKVGSDEYKQAFSNKLYEQWSSFCITENYEPGSTFKIFTAAAAIEEGVANLKTTHNCLSYVKVADITYNCANHKSHGLQTLTQGLMNSCNTFFITIGQRLGLEKYNKYFEAFGFTEKTGIDINNEAFPVYHNPARMSKVDLASTSFGQTIRISPLQLITAACSIANGGKLMQPYLVDKVVDSDGNVISQTEPTVKRRVISERTAQSVISMMEAVVEKGTGKNAYIPGYRVCGKTATAEKLDDNTDDAIYIASFLCFAPADDPQVAILVGVDNAPGPYRGGGVLAAPIAKEVLESTLKYMGVEPHYTQSELAEVSRTTPSLIGKNVSDAKIAAANEGLVTRVSGKGKKVVSQVPAGGESIPEGGVVVIYTEEASDTLEVTVPDFTGRTASEVNRLAVNSGLNVVFSGPTGSAGVRAYSQDIRKGTTVEAGSKVTVYFRTDNIAVD